MLLPVEVTLDGQMSDPGRRSVGCLEKRLTGADLWGSIVHQRVIQEALAHCSPILTARYEHLRPGAMSEAINALGDVMRAGTVRSKGAGGGAKRRGRSGPGSARSS